MMRIATVRIAGLSPRPWGTQLAAPSTPRQLRFIPTPVGNTASISLMRARSPVHPHARGEHIIQARPIDPHVRFIPTPVGNTPSGAGCGRPVAVHPHARGEHLRQMRWTCGCGGSSPRPWGTRRGPDTGKRGGRFIPTPVGNTRESRCIRTPCAVHPHARGEHQVDAGPVGAGTGSSPRPWGTHVPGTIPGDVRRFIPTPVGNTHTDLRRNDPHAVHPHARGEHQGTRDPAIRTRGSSPRPWGTHAGSRIAL